MLYAKMPYIGTFTDAPFPSFPVQSLANCCNVFMLLVMTVRILKPPLLSWLAETVLTLLICSLLLCSMALSTCAFGLQGLMALKLAMVIKSRMFTMISRCVYAFVFLVIGILCVFATRPLDAIAAYKGVPTVRFYNPVLFISQHCRSCLPHLC